MNRTSFTESADLSTDEIVAAVRGGEVEAFRQIVLRYQGEVLKIVNAMLVNDAMREDVVQQVLVKAFHSLDQYETGRGFGLWIKAIARNQVKEELRKQYRYSGRIEAYAKAVVERLDAPSEQADRERARQRGEALKDCLENIDQAAARAVRMHYLERIKTEEIARILGSTGGAIRTMLYRARGQLRACMEGKGVFG